MITTADPSGEPGEPQSAAEESRKLTVVEDWPSCWRQLAETIQGHLERGRGHLLTEDVVRFALVDVLAKNGVDAQRIAFEHRVPGMGAIDLVVDPAAGEPTRMSAAVEIKFPRDPRERNSADTMTVGELLNDFYRLARLEAAERWALQVIGARLARHLTARRDVRWTLCEGQDLCLPTGVLTGLPATARRAVVGSVDELAVTASCVTVHVVGDLTFAAYSID